MAILRLRKRRLCFDATELGKRHRGQAGITGVIMSENNERSSKRRALGELGGDRSIPRRDYRQSLAAWVCAGIQPAVRSGHAGIATAQCTRPSTLRPNCHRQLRFGRRRLYRLGHRSGKPRGQRIVARVAAGIARASLDVPSPRTATDAGVENVMHFALIDLKNKKQRSMKDIQGESLRETRA